MSLHTFCNVRVDIYLDTWSCWYLYADEGITQLLRYRESLEILGDRGDAGKMLRGRKYECSIHSVLPRKNGLSAEIPVPVVSTLSANKL